MGRITANELKTRGVAVLEQAMEKDGETIISVRGKPRYVVLEIDEYERLREADLYTAWQEARRELEAGRIRSETAREHIARLERDEAGGRRR